MDPSVRQIMQLSPPPGSGRQVDWDEVERHLGSRLPSDYRSFIEVYGGGWFGEDYLDGEGDSQIKSFWTIAIPLKNPGDDPFLDIEDLTADFGATYEGEGGPYPCGLEGEAWRQGEVLGWGAAFQADLLGWNTTDPNPDNWSVIAWRRDAPSNFVGEIPHWDCFPSSWAEFHCGMVDFILKCFRAEFEESPLNKELWGRVFDFKSNNA